jgi:hypothetical protein
LRVAAEGLADAECGAKGGLGVGEGVGLAAKELLLDGGHGAEELPDLSIQHRK